jgi:hypothetical protein
MQAFQILETFALIFCTVIPKLFVYFHVKIFLQTSANAPSLSLPPSLPSVLPSFLPSTNKTFKESKMQNHHRATTTQVVVVIT